MLIVWGSGDPPAYLLRRQRENVCELEAVLAAKAKRAAKPAARRTPKPKPPSGRSPR